MVRVDGKVVLDGPQAVLVSNNPYETGDLAGLGRRARIDQGVLGVVGLTVESAAQAAALLGRAQRSRAARSTAGPTCSAWQAATGPRRSSRASPPSGTSR